MQNEWLKITFTFILTFSVFLSSKALSEEQILKAHIRHRPPYMIVHEQFIGGSLKEILELAAKRLGYQVEWQDLPFSKSIEALKDGSVDIVPRTIHTAEREQFVQFLTPIGNEQQEILFLIRKGREQTIRNYNDLKSLRIGTKKGTAYFPQFDQDSSLAKHDVAGDDYALVNQFISGELDTVIVLDRRAMDSVLAGLGFNDYGYAQYRLLRAIDLNYGFSKNSLHAPLADALDRELQAMVAQGEVEKILASYFMNNSATADLATQLTIEERNWLQAHPGPFRVQSEADQKALNFIEENQPRGFSIDYMDLLAKKLAIPIQYVPGFSAQEAFQRLINNELDIVLNPRQTSKENDQLVFTSPYPGNAYGITLSKANVMLRDLLQKAINQITPTEMQYLYEKWPQLTPNKSNSKDLHDNLDKIHLNAEEKEWIKQHSKITFSGAADRPPFEFVQDNKYSGMAADFISVIGSLTGLIMAPDLSHTWPDGVEAAAKLGKIDLLPVVMRLDTGEETLQLTDPYIAFPVVVIMHHDAAFISGLDDLTEQKVGVVQGDPIAKKLAKSHANLHLVQMKTVSDALKALEKGQIDAYVENLAVATYTMNHLKMNQLQVMAPTPYQITLSMGVRPDWPQLRSILQKVIANIPIREKNAIRNAWMTVQVQLGSNLKMILAWVLPIIGVLILVITFVSFWNRRLGQEITKREQIQLALSRETTLLETVLSSIQQGLVAYDEQLCLILCNQQFQHLLELPEEMTIPGSHFEHLVQHLVKQENMATDGQTELLRQRFLRLVHIDEPSFDYTSRNGKIINVERGFLSTGGFVTTFTDITLRKQSEMATKVAEERSRLLLEAVGEGIFGVDKEGHFNFINPAGAAMLGYETEEIIGKNICILINHHDTNGSSCLKEACPLRQALVQEKVIHNSEEQFWRQDGGSFLVEYTSRPIWKEQILIGSVVVFHDITERILTEQRVRTLSSAVEQSPISIIIADPQARIEYVNATFCKVSGYSAEEAIGQNPRLLKSGKMDRQVYENLWATLNRGEAWEGEFFNRRKDGSYYWEATQIAPIRNRKGEVIHFLANKEDITRRKKAEAQLQEALQMISESIHYASRIQRSILTKTQILSAVLPEHFVLWEPRDLVGGDMYWYRPWFTGVLLLLADCTGHGVPGAFITLIANGALDQALLETPPGDTATLLQRMHQLIQMALGQDREVGASDDGLELGMCYLDADQRTLTFSGARFSLFVIAEGEAREIKGDKSGIGYRAFSRDIQFTIQEIELRSDWNYYLTTDGLIDQIGGESKRGFGKRRFMQLLLSLQPFPIAEHGEYIKQALITYKGEENRRDDVSVFGFKGIVC
ncbi:MAG: transporter substrate-binding domain-containing protein [Magnetococcus sp. DMHC-6]